MQGILFIISSPSGGGKGTLIREVLRAVPQIGYSVSFTTRKKRDKERDGSDYHFISPLKFEKMITADEFLEYAEVHGNLYGTSRKQVNSEISEGRDIILEIDVQGAENVRKLMPEAVGVFILPPSFDVLRARLMSRKTESADDLSVRLQNSASEVSQYANFDYVVVNDDLEIAALELKSIVVAERNRRERQIEKVNRILETFNTTKNNTA